MKQKLWPISFIMFKEGRPGCLEFEKAWIAIGLDYYIGAQGHSRENVERALRCVYRAEIEEALKRHPQAVGHPLSAASIMPAPTKYWKMWESNDESIIRGYVYNMDAGELVTLGA